MPSVLLLLPVLVLLGACTQTVPSAIATDDRPAAPQPAIASPVPAPLTIESLAGTYKTVLDEKVLRKLSSDWGMPSIEESFRQIYGQMTITINVDGTFSDVFPTRTLHGKVRLDGNKLIFTDGLAKPVDGVTPSTDQSQCACSECCTFTLNVSADRKMLLIDEASPNPYNLVRGYVKQ